MKKVALVALLCACLSSVGFAANPTSATGGPVTLTAIIPAYLGFGLPNVSSVTFDYTNIGSMVATGGPITKLATTPLPSWTLTYNLSGKPTVTVCAYATPLAGSTYSIPTSSIFAAPNGKATVQFTGDGCGQTGNAIVMDTIANATSSTGKAEAFTGMFSQTPSGVVVPPDTYTGTLNIVAQVQ